MFCADIEWMHLSSSCFIVYLGKTTFSKLSFSKLKYKRGNLTLLKIIFMIFYFHIMRSTLRCWQNHLVTSIVQAKSGRDRGPQRSSGDVIMEQTKFFLFIKRFHSSTNMMNMKEKHSTN